MAANGTAKTVRTSAGLSLREVALDVGVDCASIYRWENGLVTPWRENALKYLKVLDEIAGFGR